MRYVVYRCIQGYKFIAMYDRISWIFYQNTTLAPDDENLHYRDNIYRYSL